MSTRSTDEGRDMTTDEVGTLDGWLAQMENPEAREGARALLAEVAERHRQHVASLERQVGELREEVESAQEDFRACRYERDQEASRAEQAEADKAAWRAWAERIETRLRTFAHAEACAVDDKYDPDETEGCVCVLAVLAEMPEGDHPGAALLERLRALESAGKDALECMDEDWPDRPATKRLADALRGGG
jgi:chromosome segregation ATPase